MRKIDLSPYDFVGRNEVGEVASSVFDVKESLLAILFQPALQLNGVEVLKRDKLAQKIDVADGCVLLEDADYRIVEGAINKFKGFTRVHVEFVRRVVDAEEVSVKEDSG